MFCMGKHWNFLCKNFNKPTDKYQKLVLNKYNLRKRVN